MKTLTDTDRDLDRIADEPATPIVISVPLSDFEREVLDRLGKLQAKIEMLTGNGQPGRMALAEDNIRRLEGNDIRRSAYDRVVNAAIAVIVSAVIALHDHFGLK